MPPYTLCVRACVCVIAAVASRRIRMDILYNAILRSASVLKDVVTLSHILRTPLQRQFLPYSLSLSLFLSLSPSLSLSYSVSPTAPEMKMNIRRKKESLL